jgi:hypothetical protein
MSRWFRFYDSVLDDPKVQRLADHLFRGWVNVLCLASKNGGILPSIPDIAFALRIPDDQADSLIQALLDAGLLEDDGDELVVHNWSERQFLDRTNAQRQKRFRERHKAKTDVKTDRNAVTNAKRNVTVTPQDTDTDTETDTDTDTEKNNIRSLKLADSSFAEFWKLYPRRIGKGAAEKSWQKAVKVAPVDVILAGARNYVWPTDPQFIPHPATWLNQHRWNDEPPPRKMTLAEQYARKAMELEQDEPISRRPMIDLLGD